MAVWIRKSFATLSKNVRFRKKTTPCGKVLLEDFVPKGFTTSQTHVLCANFVKCGCPAIGKLVRHLPDQKKNKKSARAAALASARIAPKICQGQLQSIYSERPKFHPNPFTSGGVIAERVNVVQTRHKVFPIQLIRRVTKRTADRQQRSMAVRC